MLTITSDIIPGIESVCVVRYLSSRTKMQCMFLLGLECALTE